MSLNFLIILSIIQGITEFLPISSSAHLILFPFFNENPYQGRSFDVCLHFGCLLAVMYYLKKDLIFYMKIFFYNKNKSLSIMFVKLMLVGTIPVIVFGIFITLVKLDFGNAIILIGWTTLLFGILLGFSDFKKIKKKYINLKDAFLIGIFQAFAIIPGVSRSGVVITAGRLLGYSRFSSSKFSLFLSIPVIISATIFELFQIYKNDKFIFTAEYLIGIILTFFIALTTIMLFMNYIKKISLKIFVLYRVLLGLLILFFVYVN